MTEEEADKSRIADLAERLLHGGVAELSAREQRVIATIARRQHVTRSVNRTIDDTETFGDALADRVARFGGSWPFIIIFIAGLVAWVGLNALMLARTGDTFDRYPYIFLNLILSMIAALQAPIILMSQNRQAARDRVSAGLDYEVNLKAELEIMALHDKLDALRIDRLEEMLEAQREQLCALVDAATARRDSGAQPKAADSD
jgi:uncharacterized membrane protein